MSISNKLFKWLEKYKNSNDNKKKRSHTNISIGEPKISYNIPDDKYDIFLKKYSVAIDQNAKLYFVEKPLNPSLIRVDLDFRFKAIEKDDIVSLDRNDYLSDKGIKKEVIKLNQFVNHFIKFLKQEPNHSPFTFTSWQRSSTSNILTSGIAVDIGGIEFGADPRIEDLVLNSTSLPYYLKVCRANGFLVSQLAPTVMVADILSPGLLPYAKANGIFSTEDVFLSRYNYDYTIDYDLMQAKLIDGYNLFVANFPIEKINTYKCPKTISSIIKFREPITIAQAQQSISINQWLSAYTQIRNIEERGALSEQMFNKLIKRIKTTKYVDNFQAMRYINNTFRDTYKSKYGGLNYFIHREEERNKDTEPSTESTSGASKINNGGSSGGY